jgi:hypothetical protein
VLRKHTATAGLKENHKHARKAIVKSAATLASSREGRFRDFYQVLLSQGMKPAMARLTVAGKITAVPRTIWKKGAHFDAEQLQSQAA